MTDPMQQATRVVQGMLAVDAFSQWLGLELVDLVQGGCTCRMTVRPEMVNGFGVAHGGIAYALADSALAFASNQGDKVNVAIENGISYPAPVRVGDVLTAVAVEESRGGRLGFYRVAVTNQDGTAVALFQGTTYQTSTDHRIHG